MTKPRLPEIAVAAVACERATGVPAELLAAQCALESGWLTKMSGANNCFGIKSYPGEYGRELVPTTEWFTNAEQAAFVAKGEGRTAELAFPVETHLARRKYHCKDWFAKFAGLSDCFAKRAALFSVGRYKVPYEKYKADRDLIAFVRTIGPIYATAPTYAESVLLIIRQGDVLAAIAEARKKPETVS